MSNSTVSKGGSLGFATIDGNRVVKSYVGSDARGHDKLLNEYLYLRRLPPRLRQHFAQPLSFAQAIAPPRTDLTLARHNLPTIAKAIMAGTLSEGRVGTTTAVVLNLLLRELYPHRGRPITGPDVYARFHAPRLKRALSALRRAPNLNQAIEGSRLLVNGLNCPAIADAVSWLDDNQRVFFFDSQLVLAHGDAHLDNILTTTDGDIDVILIDPRGEDALPPSYDFAKMLKASRCAYDLIHYGWRDVQVKQGRASLQVSLKVDQTYSAHYRAVLRELVRSMPRFARAEGLTQQQFIRTALATEFVHIVSFAYYHAADPAGFDAERVLAYLSVAALLARNLAERKPFTRPRLFTDILSPWGSGA